MGIRQNPMPNSAIKLMEAYMDFSGGLNSEISNDRLKDSEFPILENVDLAGRGSAKRRYGRTEVFASYPYDIVNGIAQGMFHFYRKGQTFPDTIFAVSGKLYVQEAGSTTIQEIVMSDGDASPFAFQSTLPIDAVQYQGNLFIANGTKYMELNYMDSDLYSDWVAAKSYVVGNKVKANGKMYLCTTAGLSGSTAPSHTAGTVADNTVKWQFLGAFPWIAVTVTPYTPTNNEGVYIGLNGLSSNPSGFIQDVQTATAITAWGIIPDKRIGNVNGITTFTGYYNAPASVTSVDYQWEYKKIEESSWTTGQAWKTGVDGKTWKFTPDTITKYDIRLTVRATGTTTPTSQIMLTQYQVQPVAPPIQLDTSAMNRCRKIMLHWDRILLSQDDKNPYYMYASDLQNPRYFPQGSVTNFDFGKQEPVTAFVRFRDLLVVFTKSTIQTLSGKSDYTRSLIHDGLGCVAGKTAKVVGNVIIFLSSEGLMQLKPNQLVLEAMNVSRIDLPIRSEIAKLVGDNNACSVTSDGQYWVNFPSVNRIYRYYYDSGMWVRDVETLNATAPMKFSQFIQLGDQVFNLTTTGRVYKHDKTVFTDCGDIFKMVVESKFLDLSATLNYKKVKKLHVLSRHYSDHNVKLSVTVQADSAIVLSPEQGVATVDPTTNTTLWSITNAPNMSFDAGTVVGLWKLNTSKLGNVALSDQKASIRGKCKRVKVRFEHADATSCEIYGFGLQFKLKKP